jgi:hypothetical protein
MQLHRLFFAVISAFFFATATALADSPLDGYSAYDAFSAEVQTLAKSPLVTVSSLGKTLGGRKIYMLRVARSEAPSADDSAKPAILVVGSAYAPQLLGSELAVRMVRQLVAHPDAEGHKDLLGRYVLYVIPRPNPDATEAMFAQPFAERALNERPTDDDRDFETNEDPNEDLNGDGWITAMRVEDPTGKWMLHPQDGRILIEADAKKNESGRYLLYTEGIDNDKDELWNEDGLGGVDLNRNFTFGYKFFSTGAGPHQVSEVESRAIADFAFEHPNIAAVFSFSPQDNLLEPWKPGDEKQRIKTSVLSEDAPYLNKLAEDYRKLHGGKDWPSAVKGEGDFAEWAYFHYGRWSLSARAWWIPKVEPPKVDAKPASEAKEMESKDEPRGAEDLNALRWFAANKIDGFVPWTPIEHSDFPGQKVEIGGFKPLLRLNPPASQLDDLASKHAAFLGKLATLMPQLRLEQPKVEPLGGGVFRVTAKVLNTGYLPTMSAMGKLSRWPNILQMKLSLPEGAKLITSSVRVAVEPLAGNGGGKAHSWLVNLADAKETKAAVRAWSAGVGSDEKAIELK